MNDPSRVRRGAIDLARILALAVVVLGHLTLAVVDEGPDGGVRGANLFELRPAWAWVAVVAPMPVFFAAGGWANATASLTVAAPRLRTLVGLAATVVGAWSALVLLATAVAGEPGLVGDGARIATQPLWFLAAYLPFAAGGGVLAAAAARHLVPLVGGALLVLALLDLVRFGFDGPEWLGWLGFPLAWGVPWVLGAWWRDRWERGRIAELRFGVALLLGAGLAAALLVAFAGYEAALIDTGGSSRSNTTPPTLYTAVVGVAQVGLLVSLAAPLDRLARRTARFVAAAGEVALGVYLWHLTALALCAGIVSLGVPLPDRLTPEWWAIRPLWWVAVLGVTAALVGATAAARERLAVRAQGPPGSVVVWRARVGVAVATAASALVGLEGPRTVGLAALCTAGMVAGWALLSSRPPLSGTREGSSRRGRGGVRRRRTFGPVRTAGR